MQIPQRGGLPHSDIHGSTPARGSPWLFAACHVLHRLLVPRHPLNALLTLIDQFSLSPCAGRSRLNRKSHTSSFTHEPSHNACRRRAVRPRRPPGGTLHQNPLHLPKNAVFDPNPEPPRNTRVRPQGTEPNFRTRDTQDFQRLLPSTRAFSTNCRPAQRKTLVEVDGLEPTTPCLQSRCSPSELHPQRSAAPRRAGHGQTPDHLVGRAGFEPATPRLSSVCSNQLSYQPSTRTPLPQTGEPERPSTVWKGQADGAGLAAPPQGRGPRAGRLVLATPKDGARIQALFSAAAKGQAPSAAILERR